MLFLYLLLTTDGTFNLYYMEGVISSTTNSRYDNSLMPLSRENPAAVTALVVVSNARFRDFSNVCIKIFTMDFCIGYFVILRDLQGWVQVDDRTLEKSKVR